MPESEAGVTDLDRFAAAGLGLKRGTVRLVEARPEWSAIGAALSDELAAALGDLVAAVEHIGSTAVPGLAAKPILDLAVGLPSGVAPIAIRSRLEQLGWQFRGDAGNAGGLVFLLETQPMYRIAHVHVVVFGDDRWRQYVQLRDRLRTDAGARDEYSRVKLVLASRFPHDRHAYTAGKTALVEALLQQAQSRSTLRPVAAQRIDWAGRPCRLVWRPSPFEPPPSLTTQACGLCFVQSGELVLISAGGDIGSWNLPGGTIEPGETAEQALSREVAEEACARVTASCYLGCQEVFDPQEPSRRTHHFQARYWARVELLEWRPEFETSARRLVSPDDFLHTLCWGDAPIAAELLQLATAIEKSLP